MYVVRRDSHSSGGSGDSSSRSSSRSSGGTGTGTGTGSRHTKLRMRLHKTSDGCSYRSLDHLLPRWCVQSSCRSCFMFFLGEGLSRAWGFLTESPFCRRRRRAPPWCHHVQERRRGRVGEFQFDSARLFPFPLRRPFQSWGCLFLIRRGRGARGQGERAHDTE